MAWGVCVGVPGCRQANCTWHFPSTLHPLRPEHRFHPSLWKGHEGYAPHRHLRPPAGTALSGRECLRARTKGRRQKKKKTKCFKTHLYRKSETLYPPPGWESDHCSSFCTCFHGDGVFGGCGASSYCPEGHEHRYRESCGLETSLLVRPHPMQCVLSVCAQCVYTSVWVYICAFGSFA